MQAALFAAIGAGRVQVGPAAPRVPPTPYRHVQPSDLVASKAARRNVDNAHVEHAHFCVDVVERAPLQAEVGIGRAGCVALRWDRSNHRRCQRGHKHNEPHPTRWHARHGSKSPGGELQALSNPSHAGSFAVTQEGSRGVHQLPHPRTRLKFNEINEIISPSLVIRHRVDATAVLLLLRDVGDRGPSRAAALRVR